MTGPLATSAPPWSSGLQRAPAPPFACPRRSCRATLRAVADGASPALGCPRCGLVFPLIASRLPVLTPHPSRHLAEEAIRLRRDLGWLHERRAEVEAGIRRFPGRATAQRTLLACLSSTGDLLSRLSAALAGVLDMNAVLDAAASARPETSAYGARRLPVLLHRDFSGAPEAEAEVESLMGAVLAAQDAPPADWGPTLVLGSGLGRLAAEFAAAGAEISAIDLSMPLMTAAALLEERTFEVLTPSTRNARTSAGQTLRFVARMPPHLAACTAAARVRPAIADATCTPFADGAFSTVVSVYFTDLVPLSRLLPELRRLLQVGGTFVHAGPLGYHFEDLAEHLSAEELLAAFEAAGFAVSTPQWVPTTHQAIPDSLYRGHFDNLVFTATKLTSRLACDHPRPPFAR